MPGLYKKFSDIPLLTPNGSSNVDVPWTMIDQTLSSFGSYHGIDLDPDFQRGHVWNDEQRTRYVEFILRGGESSKAILFNQSGWNGGKDRGEPIVLVDGKQRLEAVMRFMRGEILAFGSRYDEFEDQLSFIRHNFRFNVNNLPTREAVLRWYVDLNAGGVVHAPEEIEKVRRMIDEEPDLEIEGPAFGR